MSPLADDCFRAGEGLITAAEALTRIADWMRPVTATETVPLAAAAGRVLAADLYAAVSAPPHDNAGVDGYAVRMADLAADGPTTLTIAHRAAAGRPVDQPLPAGAAARIFTGAIPPAGADAVVMQEDVTAADGVATIPPGVKPGANIRRAGEDLAAGTRALAAGRRLRAADLALAAAVGAAGLTVVRPLRIGVFSTGDELVDPGAPLRSGQIHDANRLALLALCRGLGAAVDDLGRLPDDRAAVTAALADAATRCDALATSGGMSRGEEDHIAAAIAAAGGALAFWRMAVKPGRPVALGRIGDCAVVGLPGNPTAAIVMFLIFGKPMLARLAGETPRSPLTFPLPAAFAMKKTVGRREYLRVRVVDDADGPRVVRAGREGSGLLTTLTNADGLWAAPEDWAGVAPGDIGAFQPFPECAL